MQKLDYHSSVQKYYGKELKTSADLKTSCCTAASIPPALRKIISAIPSDVISKFYGCGSPIPFGIQGKAVLDLGCGSGRDCYAAAAIVGDAGSVTGIDMTDEQLETARAHIGAYLDKIGVHPKVTFLKGYMENLIGAGIKPKSQDIVISNCVVNLSPDKEAVLHSVYACLKEGGEFYFSDIYADKRLPDAARNDPIIVGECVGGAMYIKDFFRVCRKRGFVDPRIMSYGPIRLPKEWDQILGGTKFVSVTFRLFKTEDLEEQPEDYGEVATYLGTMKGSEASYKFDNWLTLPANVATHVDGNVATILRSGWLSSHFRVEGSRSQHVGPCSPRDPMVVFEPQASPSVAPQCGGLVDPRTVEIQCKSEGSGPCCKSRDPDTLPAEEGGILPEEPLLRQGGDCDDATSIQNLMLQ